MSIDMLENLSSSIEYSGSKPVSKLADIFSGKLFHENEN
jgi:hypothetical protein